MPDVESRSSYSQLLLHASEKVECLERGHVVQVGLVQLVLQG